VDSQIASQVHALGMMGLAQATFKPSANNSFRGSCPQCGGHRRLVVYINGPFPAWYARCDLCSFGGWATQLNPDLDTGARFEIPMRLPAEVERRQAVAHRLLIQLRDTRADVKLFESMGPEQVSWWEMCGIPSGQQGFWQLGHTPAHAIKGDDERLHTYEAYTIPKYGLGFTLLNIDFRLVGAPKELGKYRGVPGLPPAPFISRPDQSSLVNPSGIAYVVEGSKKAMVTSMFLDDAQVIGSPAVKSWASIQESLNKDLPEVVYVILDPDGWAASRKLCMELGPKAVQVTLPGKIDDLILSGALSRSQFEQLLALSRRRPQQAMSGPASQPNRPSIHP